MPPGPFVDPSQWTVLDETHDHPGRRKNSGFFQPIKHLSGREGEMERRKKKGKISWDVKFP